MQSQAMAEHIEAVMIDMEDGPYWKSITQASQFVASGAVQAIAGTDCWRVVSGDHAYNVSPAFGCQCPQATMAHNRHCKHKGAVAMQTKLDRRLAMANGWAKDLTDMIAKSIDAYPETAAAAQAGGNKVGRAAQVLSVKDDPERDSLQLFTNSGEVYGELYKNNGATHCTCDAYKPGVKNWCEHRFALELIKRMANRPIAPAEPADHDDSMREPGDEQPDPVAELTPDRPVTPASQPRNDPAPRAAEVESNDDVVRELQIPKKYLQKISSGTHVKYPGLLWAARKRWGSDGFDIREAWTHNDENLSLAEATLTIYDEGAVVQLWKGIGDATPSNVSQGVRSSFRRMAATRAKGRALRDALGIEDATAEEIHVS